MTRRDFIKAASAGAAGAASGANAESAERQPLPTAQYKPHPDLGTHWDLFQGLSAQCVPDMSYLNEEFNDPRKWVEDARKTVLNHLHYSPPPCDPDAEILEAVDCGSYVRERIMLNTTPYTRIPAYLLRPKDLDKPAPGIVALHDHGGFYFWGKEKVVHVEPEHPELAEFKQTCYEGRSVTDELAKRGYVVIASDMLHWGERAMYLENDPERIRNRTMAVTGEDIREFNARSWAHEELVGRTALTCGATWSGMIASDDRRVADYLISRPEVDTDRVGCVGLSVGSVRTIFLGALHPKVRASVAVCWMAEYQPMVRNHVRNGIGFTKLVPGIYGHLDWPDIAGLHWPGALMTINGLQDQLYPLDAAQAAVDKVKRIFDKAGAPGTYKGVFFDGPHEFNIAMQEQAFDWLGEHLS
jgi:dienelactone hydrolase